MTETLPPNTTDLQIDPAHSPEGRQDWYPLVDEKGAAEFLGLSTRTMQGLRQKGSGPRYVALSQRCVRYRRSDLVQWCDQHLRNSTSDARVNAPKSSGTAVVDVGLKGGAVR